MTDTLNPELNTEAVATGAPKQTRREKLQAQYEAARAKFDAAAAKVNELVEEINAIDALAAVSEGSPVYVQIGKGEGPQDVPAVVLAVKEDTDGAKLYKVQYGSGFDANLVVVRAGKLKVRTV